MTHMSLLTSVFGFEVQHGTTFTFRFGNNLCIFVQNDELRLWLWDIQICKWQKLLKYGSSICRDQQQWSSNPHSSDEGRFLIWNKLNWSHGEYTSLYIQTLITKTNNYICEHVNFPHEHIGWSTCSDELKSGRWAKHHFGFAGKCFHNKLLLMSATQWK